MMKVKEMNAIPTRWDSRSAEEWLKEAARFARMALRFNHHPQLKTGFSALARDAVIRARELGTDLDYFEKRLESEELAAAQANDGRARCAHLEMAQRYQMLIQEAEAGSSGLAIAI